MRTSFLVATLTVGLLAICADTFAAEVPPAPKASTFAPAEDLVTALDSYIERIDEVLADPDEFADLQSRVVKDAETISVLALVLGLHDEDNPYKAAASELIKASQAVAQAADYAAAKAAFAQLQAAKSAKGGEVTGWVRVASLTALMEQVPLVNSRLKRYLRRFDRQADAIAVDAAVLAAIAQGSMANLDETSRPSNSEQWFAFCEQMRDAAAAVNKAARAKDQAGATAAEATLAKTCDECHVVFHPEAVGKLE
ncbi:MAG: hypothetical protein GYA33_01750 [Thermogutta sp.]|nr:hypothetical protein [Thermogutta sp.]